MVKNSCDKNKNSKNDVRKYFNPITKKMEILGSNEYFLRDDCLKYIKNNPDKSLSLFSTEHNEKGIRLHKALTYDQVFKDSMTRKFTYNEIFLTDDKIKLFIDIDVKKENIPKNVNHHVYFQSVLTDSIEVVVSELIKYNIFETPIIILNSHREDKLSSHIIFRDVVFNNVYGIKKFVDEIKNPKMEKLIEDGIFDTNPYKVGGFRMLWNTKFKKNAPLEFHEGINYDKTDDVELFYDCALKMLSDEYNYINMGTDVKEEKPKNKTKSTKQFTLNINQPPDDNSKIVQIDTLRKYVNLLSDKRKDDFKKWSSVGMILKACNPNSFDLWNEWSYTSKKYISKNDLISRWNDFKPKYYTFKSLIRLCKLDSPIEFEKIHITSFYLDGLDESIKFESPYLIEVDGSPH